MHPMLIMIGAFAVGLVICYKWAMYLIRDDKDVKIDFLHKNNNHDPN